MNQKLEKVLPIFLSILASAGVVATGVAIAKVAPKANEKIKEAKETGSKMEVVKTVVKEYKIPLVLASATIASIVSGTIISKKIEASLSATTLMLDTAYKKYKYKVKQLFGDKANEIVKSISEDEKEKKKDKIEELNSRDNRQLYHEEHVGFFKADPEDLKKAIALTNEKILTHFRGVAQTETNHWASLDTFLEDCNAERLSNDIDKVSYDYGWNFDYMNDLYKYDMHVRIIETPHVDENGIVDYIIIQFDKEPIFGILDIYSQMEKFYEDYDLVDYKNTNDVVKTINERNKKDEE